MRNKFQALLMATLLTATAANAQVSDLYATTYTWPEKPTLHKMPANFKDASAVYLMDNRIFEYKFVDKNLFQFNHVYKLIKVADDKGIEMFNKIYILLYNNSEIDNIKARVITSTGKVIDVPAGKIKDVEEEGRRYKLFAMEGLDKGSEIEYSYIIKRNPSFFGSEIFQSKEVPYYQAKVEIVTPSHLKFEAKGFNGFTVLKDSTIGEQKIIPAYSENIPGLDDEKYGLRDHLLQRVDYKFSYNLSSNADVELYTWKEFAKKYYTNLTSFTDKEKKAVAKFVNAAAIPETASEEMTIKLLEDYFKTHINVDDKLVSEDADNIEKIIKTSNTNNDGSIRFFVAMLENKNIKYQVVFPSVRDELPLDEELENWNRVDETILYFPGTGKYLQPTSPTMRYPYIDAYWAGTRGLYLKGTTIGEMRTAVGKFDTIPIIPIEEHAHNMEVSAKMDATGDSLIIESKQILKGYGAQSYRPLWAYLAKDKQEEAVKDIIGSVAKSENITNIVTQNTNLTDIWDNKPLIISGTIHSADLLEKAGNKILFKIGDLIGPQEQMYQEKPRQLPAELQYPHVLDRKLSFEIPAGYTIKNLKDLNIDIQYKKDDIVTMGFTSSYKLNNNILEVDVKETYHEILYPISEFENFKKVINASADFNKIVLLLEKK
ncbi:DUF3857 domain-containing protein [Ferruginibacter lapsinanis]|uniref:DUF3857 domain-containing protein n=1 Tax=Ferruginibacter lapsinanis TaxID=563172 RepID=UPI001E5D3565|nr:DUF3857 domain-containing protein [Ferruginibacter lapsinanis]UEG49038.1 DUF3857 domain-containing protein [Ferruginibacter lapsinanis]